MNEKHTKGETHGCIVCGRLYHLYVVRDAQNNFIGCKVMSAGGRCVEHAKRPLVACETHSSEQVEAAVKRVYGKQDEEEDDWDD